MGVGIGGGWELLLAGAGCSLTAGWALARPLPTVVCGTATVPLALGPVGCGPGTGTLAAAGARMGIGNWQK